MSIMYILHKNEENEIDVTCNEHGRDEEFIQISIRKPEGKRPLEHLTETEE